MNYHQNKFLADTYNVSLTSVGRWIKNAKNKKNGLALVNDNGKEYIANSIQNDTELRRLQQTGKLNKPKSSIKRTSPTDLFYQTFSQSQIIEIAKNLNNHSNIPNRFCYMGKEGSKLWKRYYDKNVIEHKSYPTVERNTILFNVFENIINYYTENKTVNIINLSEGYNLSLNSLVKNLLEKDKINSYSIVSLSREMAEYQDRELKKIFNNKLSTKIFIEDITLHTLSKILFKISKGNTDPFTSNLIIYPESWFGEVIDRDVVLKNIKVGMELDDILLIGNSVDSTPQRYKLFVPLDPEYVTQQLWIPKEMGIDIDSCSLDSIYDNEINTRLAFIRADKDYEITFLVESDKYKVSIYKGQRISMWRHYPSTFESFTNLISKADLELRGLTTTKDNSYMLAMCMVK